MMCDEPLASTKMSPVKLAATSRSTTRLWKRNIAWWNCDDDQILVVSGIPDDGRVRRRRRIHGLWTRGTSKSVSVFIPAGVPAGPPAPWSRRLIVPSWNLIAVEGPTTGNAYRNGSRPDLRRTRDRDRVPASACCGRSRRLSGHRAGDDTSSVMSWSTNCPTYVKPAGNAESAAVSRPGPPSVPRAGPLARLSWR